MIGLFRLDGLQDRSGLELLGIGLVVEVHCFIQRERVENGCLGVVRISLGQPRHCCLIGERAVAQIDLVVILEEDRKCLDPVLLALCLASGDASCLDRLPTFVHQFGRKGSNHGLGRWLMAIPQ